MATNNNLSLCFTTLIAENPPILPQGLVQVFLPLYFSYMADCFFAKICIIRTKNFLTFMSKMKDEFGTGFSLDKKKAAKNYFLQGVSLVTAIQLMKQNSLSPVTSAMPINATKHQNTVMEKLKEINIDSDIIDLWLEMQDFSSVKFKNLIEKIGLNCQDEEKMKKLENLIFSELSEDEILNTFKPPQFDTSTVSSFRTKIASKGQAQAAKGQSHKVEGKSKK